MPGDDFDVYHFLKPFFWVSRAFGVFPCGSKSGRVEFGLFVFNLVVHLVIFFGSFVYSHAEMIYSRQYTFMRDIENSLDFVSLAGGLMYVTLSYWGRNDISRSLVKFREVEMILNSQGRVVDFKYVGVYQLIFFSVHVTITIPLYATKYFTTFDVSVVISKATSILTSFLHIFLFGEFCTILFAIGKLCDALSLCDPKLIRRTYLDVCEICKAVNKGYEGVLCAQYMVRLFGTMSSAFYLVQTWNGGTITVELFVQISWFSFNMLKIFVCLKGCVDVTKKVSPSDESEENLQYFFILGQ